MHIDKKDLQTVKKNGSKDNDFQHSWKLSGLKLVQKFFPGVSQNYYSKYWGLQNSEDFIYQIRIKKTN